MLEIKDLYKNFKKKEVLKGINISFQPGVYGLLGVNGSGKTTLMRCIVGLYNIKKGNMNFQGKEITNSTIISKSIGYLPQRFGLFKELKVYEMLEYFSVLKKLPKQSINSYIKESLRIVNLEDRINDKISTLSGGMIRRLGIAQAILGDPKIIIFDEPTAGLDPEERLRFKNLLSQIKKDKIVIISTHIVEDVEACCNEIIIMNDGNILWSGNSEDLRSVAKGKVFEAKQGDSNISDCYIEKNFEKNGENFLRILSKKDEGLRSLESTIEDGYMCLLKGI